MSFNFTNLLEIYKKYQKQYGEDAHKYISQILDDGKIEHKKIFDGKDHEQSWRAFKGKNLEKFIIYIIEDKIKNLGLKVINGSKLEQTKEQNLSKEFAIVKRNLLIDYGECGYHLPDVDIVIYFPDTCKIFAVVSTKVTLRERIAQSGYWKLKLLSQDLTKHIQVYFITPDEDSTLTYKKNIKKGRAIVEIDLDGTYVLNKDSIEESSKVKHFDQFINDLSKKL